MAEWRSDTLLWIPIGAIALFSLGRCNDTQTLERRNYYASRQACERDYDTAQCSSGSSGGYYGPRFYGDTRTADDPGPGRTAEGGQSRAASAVHASRGGFGSTGRGHSGSG